MKREQLIMLLIVFGMATALGPASAQKPKKLPPFSMMQANGKIFKAQDLPVGKPIVLIYFSPDCDHCDVMVKELLQKTADFKKASIALITYLPIGKVSKFVKDYGLEKYPNMYVGTEGTSFFVRNYYQLKEMPFVALHNKKGEFIQSYTKVVSFKALAQKLKELTK